MKKILGIGNALIDVLIRIDNEVILKELNLPKGGMTLIDEATFKTMNRRLKDYEIERRTGGSAGNALLTVASLGGRAAFIGKTGHDDNGDFYAKERASQGVEPIELFHESLPTGVATTFITPDGERTFATYLGAAATMEAEELQQEWFEGADYFLVEGYLVQNHDLIDTAINMAHRAGAKVCLDLASWNIVEADHDFFTYLLPKIDMVFANEDEARAMTGCTPHDALEALSQSCTTAIVKLGAEGAMAKDGQTYAKIDAVKVENVVDTTGAGDFFAGGFLFRHSQSDALTDCLKMGTVCSAEVIQVLGTKLPEENWQSLKSEATAIR